MEVDTARDSEWRFADLGHEVTSGCGRQSILRLGRRPPTEDTADTAVAPPRSRPPPVFVCHGCFSRANASQGDQPGHPGTRDGAGQYVDMA
jgi:hypothetical protein